MPVLTEGQLRALPDRAKVHLTYTHPDRSQNYRGAAYVGQNGTGCYLYIGGPDSTFAMDYDYTGDDAAECVSEGDDGDRLTIRGAKQ
jgi:hypothetical protein